MHFAVVNIKGGVGKTTTAVHLAAYLNTLAKTVFLDGDPTHNATLWQERGPGFPFRIEDVRMAIRLNGEFTHTVTDTLQRPSDDDLKFLGKSSDLLIVPTTPRAMDIDGLIQTIQAFQRLGVSHYRVLLTSCPPSNEPEVEQLTTRLKDLNVPVFATGIPRLKAFDKATTEGVMVSAVKDPRASRGWDAYVQVGKEAMRYASSNQKART
jgi:chromosome partitioning protein